VLTGGGSRCRGTRQLCEEVFDLPVTRRHLPARLKGADQLPSGQWATVLGLSLWAAGDFQDGAESEIGGGGGGGLLGKLRGMFKRKPEKELEAQG
jgi:cell division ATPase FtsA